MYDLLADVKLSIELEENGYDFYKKTAKATQNPLAASTLDSLGEREKEHIKRITEFYQSLSSGKKLEANWLISVEVPPTKKELLRPIIAKLKAGLDKKFETQKDINDAYKIAEGLEVDSYTLYEKISKETDDEIAKKFYKALADEEREHYAILDETLLYLNDPAEWFHSQEKWILEG